VTGATTFKKATNSGRINAWQSQEFLALYPRRDTHICKLQGQDKWRTWTGPLEDHQILGVIQDGGRGILRGCHWGRQTRFAVLDIDNGSRYHNSERLAKLTTALAAVGLNTNLYQSSESGGWHVYVPFTEWAESEDVEKTLKRWLKALGYDLRGGQLEVFPSGNALRLPLQPGFGWLSPDGYLIRTREEITLESALTSFLFDLEINARNWQTAKDRIESQIQAAAAAAGSDAQGREERLDIEGFEHVLCHGKIHEIWEKGREWWRDGLQEHGERHNAVLAVGHYLWYGDEERRIAALLGERNDEYRAMLIEQWLKTKHNGKCRHINQGKWAIVLEQIQRAVIWRGIIEAKERPSYPLTNRLLKRLVALYRRTGKIWCQELFERANDNRRLEARARIAEAICSLEDEKQLITIAEVARRAHAHWRTVKKNRDLLQDPILASVEAPLPSSLHLETLSANQCSTPLEVPSLETETNSDLLARSAIVLNYGGGCPQAGCSGLDPKSPPEPFELLAGSSHLDTETSHKQLSITFCPAVETEAKENFDSSDRCQSLQLVEPGFVGSDANMPVEDTNPDTVNELGISKQSPGTEKSGEDMVNQAFNLFVLPAGSENRLRALAVPVRQEQMRLVWSAESQEGLTPYVTPGRGQTAKTQGKREPAVCPPSTLISLTPGSSRGCAPRLRGTHCFFCTCGISSLATLAPVFLGNFFYGEHQLKSKARGKQALLQESAGGCRLNQHQTEVRSWPAAIYRLLIDTGDS
jgi:hypothetical protein